MDISIVKIKKGKQDYSNRKLPKYAEEIGLLYSDSKKSEDKKPLGQYLTPEPVANFMAEMLTPKTEHLKILDPGAGTGILSCAAIQSLVEGKIKPNRIELVAYEVDKTILPYLAESLEYAKQWLAKKNIKFTYEIRSDDFILDNSSRSNGNLDLFENKKNREEKYDYIICNPPYFKLHKNDSRAKAVSHIVHGQPNIYALFMFVAATLLRDKGEMVFIVPRSFTSGQYFRLFREKFFALVNPSLIHIFESRKDTFNRDNVLQENIILKASKDKSKKNPRLILSYSKNTSDLSSPIQTSVTLSEVIDGNNSEVLRLPLTFRDKDAIKKIKKLKYSLSKLGMKISTGPIVPFRSKDYLEKNEKRDAVPFLWMQNVKPMTVKWPLKIRKPQYVIYSDKSTNLLITNRNYVILRRFSAKEEKRRVTSSPYLANDFPYEKIGLENHLNYIYKIEGEFSKEEVFGLSAILNSSLVNTFFRTSNGHTQVNASELRDVPLPSLDNIKNIGLEVINKQLTEEQIDKVVEKVVNME